MNLNVLIIEDSDDDALLMISVLNHAGYEVHYQRVESRTGLLNALHGQVWDVILSDHNLPGFSSTEALQLLSQQNHVIPFIIVSGVLGEELAVEAMKAGAQDYVMKEHLARLVPAVRNALTAGQAKRGEKLYQQRLRELGLHLQLVREEERARVARELHDEMGGLLTALKMDTHWLERQFADSSDEAAEKLSMMAILLDNAIETVRRIITDLRPSVLDTLGLVAAMEWQAEAFSRRHGIPCHVQSDAGTHELADKQLEVTVFRIFQEALTNISRHAKAGQVQVTVSSEDNTLRLSVQDDGIGIAASNKLKQGAYGILGMSERAIALGGTLDVINTQDGGSRVELSLPLK